MTRRNTPRLCFIGFGEAGQAFASGLREAGVETIAAWDILFPKPEGEKLREAGAKIGARLGTSTADAVAGSDIVISAVTAASSLDAARSVKPHLTGQLYLDINSVSPGRKQETAKELGDVARYVDVAVMAPVHPARHKTPILLAGEHKDNIGPLLSELGMKVSQAEGDIGAAAAIKMVRGVMIKGIEALTAECFLAAQRAGVTEQVLASLSNNYPSLDWGKVVEYNLERMASHGIRRAAEMEEVADTLKELGIEPLMARATVARQRELGELGKQPAIKDAKLKGRAEMLSTVNKARGNGH